MQIKIFSIKDSRTEVYNQPFYQRTHGDAERYLRSIVNEDPKNLPGFYKNVATYPKDYDLYYLGQFDDENGKFTLEDKAQHVCEVHVLKNVPHENLTQ